jgi:hypothetical protein
MATMSSSVFRGSRLVVHVALHNRSFPEDAEWQKLCDELAALLGELGGAERLRALVVTDGGAPTSKQRSVLRTAANDTRVKAALVTSSRLALGIGTAIGWINTSLKSFAPKDFAKAVRYLDLPEDEWPLLAAHLAAMRTGLQVDTLDAINTRALRVAR